MTVFWLRYRVEFGLIRKVWRNLLPPYSRMVFSLDRRQSRMTELCPGRFTRLPRSEGGKQHFLRNVRVELKSECTWTTTTNSVERNCLLALDCICCCCCCSSVQNAAWWVTKITECSFLFYVSLLCVTNDSINLKHADNIVTLYEAMCNFCTREVIGETE